jgi:hypothetical protein
MFQDIMLKDMDSFIKRLDCTEVLVLVPIFRLTDTRFAFGEYFV